MNPIMNTRWNHWYSHEPDVLHLRHVEQTECFMFCLKCLSDRPSGNSRRRQGSKTVRTALIPSRRCPIASRFSGLFPVDASSVCGLPDWPRRHRAKYRQDTELIRYTRRWFAIAGDSRWLSTPSQDISGRPLRSAAESFLQVFIKSSGCGIMLNLI